MNKLYRTGGRSSAWWAVTLVVILAMAMGATGVASAAPGRHHSLRAWIDAHEIRVRPIHRLHTGQRSAHAAVVGGNQIEIEQAPWQVAVLGLFTVIVEEEGQLREVHSKRLCGGSILDATHVLTAGHCLYNPVTGEQLPASDLAVVAGVSDLASPGGDLQFSEVAKLRIHPYYSYSAGAGAPDDVAVIGLSEAASAGYRIASLAAAGSGTCAR